MQPTDGTIVNRLGSGSKFGCWVRLLVTRQEKEIASGKALAMTHCFASDLGLLTLDLRPGRALRCVAELLGYARPKANKFAFYRFAMPAHDIRNI